MIPDRVSRLRSLFSPSTLLCAAVFGVCALSPSGATAAEDTTPSKLDELSAVVHVRATLPKNSDATRTWGSAREGNGVVIDSSGLILTVRYLIRRAAKIEVTDQSGKVVPAKVIAYDQTTGFGLIKADGLITAKPMRLGDSNALPDATPLLAVSHGKGQPSVTPTRLVTRYDYAAASEYLVEKSILTYPSHDNFGGAALVNEDGRLVGLGSIVLKAAGGQGTVSTNLWLPINGIKPILADLIEHGSRQGPRHPWLGLRGQELDGHLMVVGVEDGGPGDKAGIKMGDLILGVGGRRVSNLVDYYRQVWSRGNAGAVIPIDVLRFKSEIVGVDRVEVTSIPFDETRPPGGF